MSLNYVERGDLPPMPEAWVALLATRPLSQRCAVGRIWESAWENGIPGSRSAPSYEPKALLLEVNEKSPKYMVCQITMGRKDDEDTMARVFCRTYATFIIGASGRISFSRKARDGSGRYIFERNGTRKLYRAWSR